MSRVAPLSDIDFSVDEMMKYVARFKEQKSTSKSFIDTRIAGHERDIFSIIGAGVIEDPDLRPSIVAQDFHLSIVKAEPGKGASLHSHLTQEVFMPLSGRWAVFWGPHGRQGSYSRALRRDLGSNPCHARLSQRRRANGAVARRRRRT